MFFNSTRSHRSFFWLWIQSLYFLLTCSKWTFFLLNISFLALKRRFIFWWLKFKIMFLLLSLNVVAHLTTNNSFETSIFSDSGWVHRTLFSVDCHIGRNISTSIRFKEYLFSWVMSIRFLWWCLNLIRNWKIWLILLFSIYFPFLWAWLKRMIFANLWYFINICLSSSSFVSNLKLWKIP